MPDPVPPTTPPMAAPPAPDPTAPPVVVTAPVEAPVSRAEFERLMADVGGVGEAVRQLSLSGRTAPVAVEPEITDAQIEAAVNDGNTMQAMRLMNARTESRLLAMQNNFQIQGLALLEGVSSEVANSKMKYYAKFKREIDANIASMAPNLRASAQARVLAHDYVVGQHIHEILAEEKTAWERAAAAPPAPVIDPTAGDGSGRRQRLPGDVPTPAELLGSDVAIALADKGDPTGDAYAHSRGYADWKDYVAKTELSEETVNAYLR